MIDNLNLVLPLLVEEGHEGFYQCFIVSRVKDGNDKNIIHKSYYIRNQKELLGFYEEIKLLCEHYKARTYINLTYKSYKSLYKNLAIKILKDDSIINPVHIHRVLDSAAGITNGQDKKWVVDIDDVNNVEEVKECLYSISNIGHAPEEVILATIPTKNGVHLITKPFDRDIFNKQFPLIQVHINSMGTLLYYPNSLNNK
jgi:hypothetical protein